MAQNDSAAKEILGWREKLGQAANWVDEKFNQPRSSSKPDTSWNDEMVRKANESFRQAAAAKTPARAPAKKSARTKSGR